MLHYLPKSRIDNKSIYINKVKSSQIKNNSILHELHKSFLFYFYLQNNIAIEKRNLYYVWQPYSRILNTVLSTCQTLGC